MSTSYTLINTNEQLVKLVEHLEHTQPKEIAVDFEGDFSRYRYGFTLCLVQIYDGTQGYIVDPLAVNVKLMKQIFMGPIPKVMFDPSGDLMLLKNSENMSMRNVIDVQMAAKLLNYPKLALTVLLKDCLGVEIKNKKKFQTANWTRRPLEKKLLDYAIGDVLHLLNLKEILLERVEEEGKYEQFIQMTAGLEKRDYIWKKADRHLKIKNAHHLQQPNKLYLKYFFECRERIAKARNMPPNFVMLNETLLQISQTPPTNKQEWLDLKGTHKSFPRYINKFSLTKSRVDRILQERNAQKKEGPGKKRSGGRPV